MTLITPTIAADANPGPLVYAELATAMLALGWTLDDTRVIGARTHKVMKSAAAGNSRNLDWYLDISYPTTGVASGLLITPFEGYNSATGLATRGPYSANDTTLDGTTYSRFGATASALETNWANTASWTQLDSPLSISSFAMIASITRDRVILLVGTEPTQASYAGFFTPTAEHAAHAGAALFPLITTRLSGATARDSSGGSGSVQVAMTRLPKVSTVNWNGHCTLAPITSFMGGRVGGAVSAVDNRVTGSPFYVAAGATATGGAATIGELDGVLAANADPAVVRGDTVNAGDYVSTTVVSSTCILIEAV
jgi:hypothetical protein